MTLRVLFYVQHLLGMGHLARALRIAQALVRAGAEVELVLGGTRIDGLVPAGVSITHLPAVKAGPAGFTGLVDDTGNAIDDVFRTRRKDLLLATCARIEPHAVLIEAFPFGRRQMRFELEPLLDAVTARRPRPLVVCSVRDILQSESRPERIQATLASLDRWFDAVLVHGDPALAWLDESYPAITTLRRPIHYTGLVGPPRSQGDASVERRGVVASAGGGAVGARVLAAAIMAKPKSRLAQEDWLVVTGPQMKQADREQLKALAEPAHVHLERFLPDLGSRFRSARLAIAQAGYNTVAELMAAGCASVLVPFAENGETEQSFRAARLQRLGLAIVVEERNATPERMAQAIDRAAQLAPAPASRFALDGAERSAAILLELVRQRGA